MKESCSKFEVGDIVQLKDQNLFGGGWKGPMKILHIFMSGSIQCYCPYVNKILSWNKGNTGSFKPNSLELIKDNQLELPWKS